MLTFFVDYDAIDAPDDPCSRRKHMLHEGSHVDMGLIWLRRFGIFAERLRHDGAKGEEQRRDAGKGAAAYHFIAAPRRLTRVSW